MLTLNFLAFRNIPAYLSSITPFLERDEVQNGLLLGAIDSLRHDPPSVSPVMFQVLRDSAILGTAFYLNRNLLLSGDFDGATELLVQYLMEEGIRIPSVLGPAQEAAAFAESWSRSAGCQANIACVQGLYCLTGVESPESVEGQMRVAAIDETDLIYQWSYDFRQEAIRYEPFDADELRTATEKRIRQGMTFVWEMDGQPVSMASLTRPTRRGITVNAVYTPPDLRCRGYGSALVAAVSNEGLNRDKDFCILYTDLANPTPNSIYRKVGYALVSHAHNYRFNYGASDAA